MGELFKVQTKRFHTTMCVQYSGDDIRYQYMYITDDKAWEHSYTMELHKNVSSQIVTARKKLPFSAVPQAHLFASPIQ